MNKRKNSKSLFVVILSFTVILFVNIFLVGPSPSASLHFQLYAIPISISAYLYGIGAAICLASISFFQGVLGAALGGRAANDAIFLAFAGGTFLLISKIAVKSREGILDKRKKMVEFLEDEKTSYEARFKENDELLKNNKELEVKGSSFAELYETSKDMGVSLDFESILDIAYRTIRKRFGYDKGTLFLKRRTESKNFDSRYDLVSGKIETEVRIDMTIELEEILNERRQVFRIPDSGKGAFLGAPLALGDEIIGAAILENLTLQHGGKAEDDREEILNDFSILSSQLALQLRKALLLEEIERLAITDGLTDIALRRHFLQRLGEELKRSKHHGLSLAFLMLDIDRFKSYNDNHGHLVGDAVLKETARILKETVREVDLAGRYGGEEFCIMMPETDKQGTMKAAERIRTIVEKTKFRAYDEETSITVSIGFSCFPEDAEEEKDLIGKADEALLEAKRSGRNRVCQWEKGKG